MSVRVFSTGRVRQKRGRRGVRRYFAQDWSPESLPVNVFLVEHPCGLCLVDAGQTAAAADEGYFPGWYPFFRLARFELTPEDTAASQLVAAGVRLTDIRWVVLTHLHTDHAGGIGAFPGAEVIVTRTEWEPAQGIGGRLRGYLPQYWPPGVTPHVVDFSDAAIGPFSGSYDIASDGRLLLVPLPGHTRGHSALLVQLTPSQRFLCAGDAAHDAAELEAQLPDVAAWCRREQVEVLLAHDDTAAARAASASSIAPR